MQADYDDYTIWKDWNDAAFMTLGDQQRRYYADEMRGLSLKGRDVLEIGFGSGAFLGWAGEQGAALYGTESIASLCALAAAKGVTVLPIDLAQSLPARDGQFAAVVAFDVMEHLTIDQNRQLLEDAARLLADGGLFVARFPNGQSPFGRAYQHGDLTHRSTLSAEIVPQLARGLAFDMVHLGNQAPARAAGLRGVGAAARGVLQRMIEGGITRIYGMSAPLGPNTVAVLRRRPREPA